MGRPAMHAMVNTVFPVSGGSTSGGSVKDIDDPNAKQPSEANKKKRKNTDYEGTTANGPRLRQEHPSLAAKTPRTDASSSVSPAVFVGQALSCSSNSRSNSNNTNQAQLLTGAAEDIQETLSNGLLNDKRIMIQSLRKIGNYCADSNPNAKTHKKIVIELSGHVLILNTLKRTTGDIDIQREGYRALMYMLHKHEYVSQTKALLGEQGAVEAAVQAMKVHVNDSAFQLYGCGVLCALIRRNGRNMDRMVVANGIHAIMVAMRANCAYVELNRFTCDVLTYVLAVPQYLPSVVDAHCLTALSQALEMNKDHPTQGKYLRKKVPLLIEKLPIAIQQGG